MKISTTFVIAMVLLGCKEAKELQQPTSTEPAIELSVDTSSNEENSTNQQTDSNEIIYLSGKIGELSARSDAFTIESAAIDGSILCVTITYSGGCEEHQFECIGSRAVAKSYPPQRSIKLIHKANNDMCEAMITKKIEIDILPFSVGPNSEMVLHLNGFSTPLKFKHI